MNQLATILILAPATACVAWTVTKEEVFRELREKLAAYCKDCRRSLLMRKFCYLFTCEYCFSHYVAGFWVLATGAKLAFPNPLGGIVAWLTLIWLANHLMTVYSWLRQQNKKVGGEAERAVQTARIKEVFDATGNFETR